SRVTIATRSGTLLPGPNTTSGTPVRSARWWSRVANPSCSSGASAIARAAAAGVRAPRRTRESSARSSSGRNQALRVLLAQRPGHGSFVREPGSGQLLQVAGELRHHLLGAAGAVHLLAHLSAAREPAHVPRDVLAHLARRRFGAGRLHQHLEMAHAGLEPLGRGRQRQALAALEERAG